MSNFRQIGLGFLAAVFSSALVFGSMLLALVEGGKLVAIAPLLTPTNTFQIATPKPGEPTFTPTPSPTPTVTPTPSCAETPPDWIDYTVVSGQTLLTISQEYNISLETLYDLNCLQSEGLIGGIVLKVPQVPLPATPTPTSTTPTPTATKDKPDKPKASPRAQQACSGHPSGWVTYRVRSGDNLFRIALSYGLSTRELMAANCLSTTTIRPGQIIFVPGYPPRTPRPSATRVQPTPRPTINVPPPDPSDPPAPEPSEPPAPVPSEPPSPEPSEPPAPVPSEPPSPEPSEPPSPEPSEPPPSPYP
jgi:LysM repeat protein